MHRFTSITAAAISVAIGCLYSVQIASAQQSVCGASLVAPGVAVHENGSNYLEVYSRTQAPPRVDADAQIEATDPWLLSREVWLVVCANDSMTDRRTCRVIGGGTLGSEEGETTNAMFKFNGSSDITSVCVNGNNFPGRVGGLRIGEFAPYETDEKGCVTSPKLVSEIVSRLVVGTRLRTRHVQWPNDVAVDDDYRVTPTMLSAIAVGRCLFLNGSR
jgi:hypothetical protein